MNDLLHQLRNDAAENSILQTISIAVSTILIGSGLITAPGLINNARDNNARGDLDNIAYAEEMLMAAQGIYTEAVLPDVANSLARLALSDDHGSRYNISDKVTNVAALVCDTPEWSYLLRATSASGTTFYRSSASPKTARSLDELEIASCIDTTDFELADSGNPGDGDGNGNGGELFEWQTDLYPVVEGEFTGAIWDEFRAGTRTSKAWSVYGVLGRNGFGGGHNINLDEQEKLPEIPDSEYVVNEWGNEWTYKGTITSSSITLPNGETAVGKRTNCDAAVVGEEQCSWSRMNNEVTFIKYADRYGVLESTPFRVSIDISEFEFENEYTLAEMDEQIFEGAVYTVTMNGNYTFKFLLDYMSYAT